jgi:hypothetical protein
MDRREQREKAEFPQTDSNLKLPAPSKGLQIKTAISPDAAALAG